MAEDWKVGDLALVVLGGEQPCPNRDGTIHLGTVVPNVGTIHEVLDVKAARVGPSGNETLNECGCGALHFGGDAAATEWRCVKVTPIEEDDFDRETITLMKKADKKRIKELSE